jgi:hypothetical protein
VADSVALALIVGQASHQRLQDAAACYLYFVNRQIKIKSLQPGK